MLGKLKEKKAVLELRRASLVSEIESVDKKIAIVDEMIAEESSTTAETAVVAEAKAEAVETDEKRTIEFGTITRSSF